MSVDLSIVVPIHNEESNLPVLYQRITEVFSAQEYAYEVILVNDGSRDKSLTLIKQFAANDNHFHYVDLSRNFGHQAAIFAGMEHARGKWIAFIDGDLQDPPELIPDMLRTLQQGYDVVYAKRRKRAGVGFFKRSAYTVFYRLLDKITDIEIPLDTGDFRVITARIARHLRALPEKDKFLRGQIAWLGFNQTFIEYDRPERFSGEVSYTFSKMMRLALEGITSFSDLPLRLASYLGFTVSGISFLLMFYALISKYVLNNGTPQGWTSLMLVVLFLGGVQLITIGIIGEYLIRISNNVKDRPVYIVRETNAQKN